MRRNSKLAERLIRALSRKGITVDGRRLERWCGDGLGADPLLPFRAQVDHYACLASLASSGRDADVVARRLASWGFGCERYRGAILRGFWAEAPGAMSDVPKFDFSSDGEADRSFWFVDQIASGILSDRSGLPPLMSKGMTALLRNAARNAGRLDATPEEILHSVLVSTLCHLFGGEHYSGGALAAVANLDPETFGDESVAGLNAMKFDFEELERVFRHAPLDEIVTAAKFNRVNGPEILGHLDVRGVNPAELEDAAGLFAPMVVWLFRTFAANFEDFPEDPFAEMSLAEAS